MGVAITPRIDATYSSDGYIPLAINGLHGSNAGQDAQKLYISRWNQYDNTWGAESVHEGGTFNGAAPGSTIGNRIYRWRVRGWRGDTGWGPHGYSEFVQTSPNAPSNVHTALAGPGALTITWQDNGYAPYYTYQTEIWLSTDNGFTWNGWATVASGTTSAYASGLTPGVTYQFSVRHVETAHGRPSPFGYTAGVTAQTVPATPGAMSANRVSDASASLSWSNNSSAGAPYESLTVQRWDSVIGWANIARLTGTLPTTLTDSAIVAGKKYQYRVSAGNSLGSSEWSYSGVIYTTPTAPNNASALYTGGTSISLSWGNPSAYTEYGVKVQAYKNGGVDGSVVTLTTGTTSYTKTAVDPVATYYFKVWAVSDVGALASTQTQSNSVQAATAPNAPTGLTGAAVIDKTKTHSVSWTHSPSIDGSAQTKYQFRHRLVGAGTWVENTVVTSAVATQANPFSGYTNGQTVEWAVRTYGIHANPSPYSATATQQTSTTPTVNVTSPGTTVTNSVITVAWTYGDAESTAQTEWRVDLFDSASGVLIETRTAADAAVSAVMAHGADNGVTYRVDVTVRDGSGLWSSVGTKTFTATFVPPAEVLLTANLDSTSGSTVLALTPTAHDNGVTKHPASSVTIERQFWDDEIEDFGPWETLIAGAPVTAVLVDTTGPTQADGQYRVTAHSTAPSTYLGPSKITPMGGDPRWLYVSGGEKFDVVCKMWANIEITQTASRSKALHYFAGRKNPVIYSGDAAERTYTITGILDDEASPPQQWIRLARQTGAVLLRAPGRRMYGSLTGVSVDRIQNNLHQVSFSIQEVSL